MSRFVDDIYQLYNNKKEVRNYYYEDKEPDYSNYFFGRCFAQLYIFASLVVLRKGKSKQPMCDLDRYLIHALNDFGFFPNSIGQVFGSQLRHLLEPLQTGKDAIMLFADAYNLQKAKKRSQLWNIWFQSVPSKALHVHVLFGPSKVLPLLPYDIVGAATCIFEVAKLVKKDIKEIVWSFPYLLSCKNVAFFPDLTMDYKILPTRPPLRDEAIAALEINESLKVAPNIKPMLKIPMNDIFEELLIELKAIYTNQLKAGTIIK